MSASEREYIAFISYRHKDLDKYVAKKVHTLIEHYVVPKELRGAAGAPGKRLGFVFRDEEELPVSSNLTDSIQTALDHSKYLIVICTPDTPESLWVEREIGYFLEHHDRSHVIGVLVNGTPEQSFPKLLTTIYGEDGATPVGAVEPLAANLTNNAHQFEKKRIKKEAVRLYAALIGCPFDALWQRDRRYKLRCVLALMALALTVAMSFSLSIYLKNLQIIARNQQIEEQNTQIQQQNEEIQQQNTEIKAQNEEIREKNTDLALREADAKIKEARLLYEKGDMSGAVKSTLAAIAEKEGREAYGAEAEYLLTRALGAGQYDNVMRTTAILEQDRAISDIQVSAALDAVFTMDDRGYVRCFSAEDGGLLWTGDSESRHYHSYVVDKRRMTLLQTGLLLCCNDDSITALRAEDGSTVWQYVPSASAGADFACLSPDEKALAVIRSDGLMHMQNRLVILDADSGEVTQELSLDGIFGDKRLMAYGLQNGVFSEDGRYLAAMVYEDSDFYGCDGYRILLADLQEGTVKAIYSGTVEMEYFKVYPFAIGLYIQPERQSVLVLHYNVDLGSVCMEEIGWNGKRGKHSEVDVALPDRELNGLYDCTFRAGEENQAILASCADMNLIYRKGDGELISSRRYSTAMVLDTQWMDETNYTRALLTGDGMIYALYDTAGYAIASFGDKIHLNKLAVSEGYVMNRGGFGQRLAEDAVMAVQCDDSARRIYIQKPAKDGEVREALWYEAFDLTEAVYHYEMTMATEDTLVVGEVRGKDRIALEYVDIPTQTVKSKYEINPAEIGDAISDYTILQGLFWPDCDHITLQSLSDNLKVYSLAEGKLSEVFEEPGIRECKVSKLKDGSALHVGIATTESVEDAEGLSGKLLLRRGLGEVVELPNSGEMNWFLGRGFSKNALLRTGGNGYVLVGQFPEAGSEAFTESFWVYCLADGATLEIADACPSDTNRNLVMGEELPIFATADTDGYLRIYDMERGALRLTIPEPLEPEEILDILLCAGDRALAVWTLNRDLFLYDTQTGELLWQGTFENETTNISIKVNLETSVWDAERERIYFITAQNAVICINAKKWKKIADFTGLDAFCPVTNEIYKMKFSALFFREEENGILRCRAYTLEELEDKAKREIKGLEE